MSDENVGGLVELLPCPFCGSQPKLETHSQYHSYSAREAQQDGMGYSAGGFSTTSWSVDCACGISVPGNNDAFLVQRWNTRALSAHGQPVVDEAMVKRAAQSYKVAAERGGYKYDDDTLDEHLKYMRAALLERLESSRETNAALVLGRCQMDDEIAALQAKLDAVTKDAEALRSALNPQQWNAEMSTAWHLNIPDLQKAFEELTKAALTDQGRAGEGE